MVILKVLFQREHKFFRNKNMCLKRYKLMSFTQEKKINSSDDRVIC